MLSSSYKRPLAILAVAGGLLAAAAGPANASASTPAHKQTKAATSAKVTMEDILVTSVSVTPEHSQRARRRGRPHRGGNGDGVTAMYDVRGQNQV
jgi:hypothetical protein